MGANKYRVSEIVSHVQNAVAFVALLLLAVTLVPPTNILVGAVGLAVSILYTDYSEIYGADRSWWDGSPVLWGRLAD